jgi:hypothetical protein
MTEENKKDETKTESVEHNDEIEQKEENQDKDSDGFSKKEADKLELEMDKKTDTTQMTFKEKVLDLFKNPKKRGWTIAIIIIIFTLIGFAAGAYFLLYDKSESKTGNADQNSSVELSSQEPAAELFQSPLDGLMVSKDASLKHPLAIVVENHTDARPQSGLDKASVVYEAIAEGGITRFLALFSSFDAEKVGPVRSVRTFFVDWAHGYNAYIAHVGGNMDALDKIKSERSLDLDQFAHSKPYWREYSTGLATEHTMYTSTSKLRDQAATLGYSTANNFTVYKFKDDPTGADKELLPASQKISVDFSNASYNATFQYDKETNSYKRLLAGKAHTDRVTKSQLNPKNVIVMTVARKAVVTRINEQGYEMTTVGSGKAKIFIDGKIIEGNWKKSSAADREIFYDSAGNEITFNRGQFWICVTPPDITTKVE